jgi:hypothetical protein
MVPHWKVLQAISLVSLCRADSLIALQRFQAAAGVVFPGPVAGVVHELIMSRLPPELEARLRTTDIALSGDIRPLMEAAAVLGISDVIVYNGDGPGIGWNPTVVRWRADKNVRIFVETCLLAGVPITTVAADINRMWGYSPDETALCQFYNYFCDREYIDGDAWAMYANCVGATEATFKRGLMQQPHDFIRWKLGVPVELRNEIVLDRLISDAYYTERLLKFEAGSNGIRMSKDELTRLKLERDTLFKALAWKEKLKTAASADGGTDENAAKVLETLRSIGLQTTEQDPPLLSELDELDNMG